MSRTLMRLLLLVSLMLVSSAWNALAAAGSEAPSRLLDRGRALLEAGELDGARQLFADVVSTRRAELRPEELVKTLVALATIEQQVGRERQALDWWIRALVPADTVARAEGSENPDLGIFVRVQIAALLRGTGDLAGSEAMGWESVQESVASGRLESAPVGVLTVLRVAALESVQGVRERTVELDELLSGFEGYRLHALPRPLPLALMAHDVGRQYAEAGLFEEATSSFATAMRTYEALGAPDLASRASVDLARSAMEEGRLQLADDVLARGATLDPMAARNAGSGAVAAELELLRGGLDGSSEAFAGLAEQTSDASLRALYLGRAARLAGVRRPETAVPLHREAIRLLSQANAPGEALVERTLLASQHARLRQWSAVADLLAQIDASLEGEEAPTLPSDVTARLEVTRASLQAHRDEYLLARAALAAAGTALFRRADTDGVAAIAVQYVELALDEGDAEAVDAALANAREVEESLGLRVEGWRALAAVGRVASSRGDSDMAYTAFAEAADRVEWLAWSREVPREAALMGDPADRLYRPWLETLLEEGRHEEAFVVLQRMRGFLAGPVVRPDASLAAQVTALRETLREISTRATEQDKDTLRAPLLDELARLRGQISMAPGCDADAVRAALPDRWGVLDGFQGSAGRWLFLVDRTGMEVASVPPGQSLSRKAPLSKRLKRLAGVAHTGLEEATAPVGRRVTTACDVPEPWAKLSGQVLSGSDLPRPASDLVSQALGSGSNARPPLDGAVVLVAAPPAPSTLAQLRDRGAAAVVQVVDVEASVLADRLAAGKTLDAALSALRGRKASPAAVWGPLPGGQ